MRKTRPVEFYFEQPVEKKVQPVATRAQQNIGSVLIVATPLGSRRCVLSTKKSRMGWSPRSSLAQVALAEANSMTSRFITAGYSHDLCRGAAYIICP